MHKSLAFVLAAAAIAAVVASPADAKPRRQVVTPNQGRQLQAPQAANPANDPTGVYRNGVLIGRDPDPAIRAQILGSYGHGGAP